MLRALCTLIILRRCYLKLLLKEQLGDWLSEWEGEDISVSAATPPLACKSTFNPPPPTKHGWEKSEIICIGHFSILTLLGASLVELSQVRRNRSLKVRGGAGVKQSHPFALVYIRCDRYV